jgi:hypothetical protein
MPAGWKIDGLLAPCRNGTSRAFSRHRATDKKTFVNGRVEVGQALI